MSTDLHFAESGVEGALAGNALGAFRLWVMMNWYVGDLDGDAEFFEGLMEQFVDLAVEGGVRMIWE